jgi:predicted nucleic acid-binding protein
MVIDTTVLIDLARGHAAARIWALTVEQQLVASEVTRFELLVGVRAAERRVVEQLMRACQWVAVDEAISRTAASLGQRWRKGYPGLGMADLLIAATAMELGAPLATANVRHFPMFPRLAAPY